MTDKLKVGAVSYLNTKPLVWGLDKMDGIIDLHYEVPSKLFKMFAGGLLDIALIPIIRYFGNEDYRVIPDISISSKGRVESVNLYVTGDVNNIKTVALDTSSLTSRALTAVILKKRYNLSPDFIDWNNGPDIATSGADATLIIGDNAMKPYDNKYKVLDLGEEWMNLTGLPFVFAVWVTKDGADLRGFDKVLKEAKENGINSLEKIAEAESKRLNFSKEVCLNYLSKAIHYDLGKDEINGVEKFNEYTLELGLQAKAEAGNKVINSSQSENGCMRFYTG